MATSAERVLLGLLLVTVLDLGYLATRYTALRFGGATPGTGLCSISAKIDCDPVLLSAPARAFYVPNAYLGLGFFAGATIFYVLAYRRGGDAYRAAMSVLMLMLGLATLVTFRLFALLVRLPTLCVVCPWNHLLTWAAFAASIAIVRARGFDLRALGECRHAIGVAVVPFVALLAFWVSVGDEHTRWPR